MEADIKWLKDNKIPFHSFYLVKNDEDTVMQHLARVIRGQGLIRGELFLFEDN